MNISSDPHILFCFWQWQAISLQPLAIHSILFRALLYFLLIPAGTWKQENNCKARKKKKVIWFSQKESPQKHLASTLLHPGVSLTKSIRQTMFSSPWTFELIITLDCLFCNSRQWMPSCWSNKLGQCFKVQRDCVWRSKRGQSKITGENIIAALPLRHLRGRWSFLQRQTLSWGNFQRLHFAFWDRKWFRYQNRSETLGTILLV